MASRPSGSSAHPPRTVTCFALCRPLPLAADDGQRIDKNGKRMGTLEFGGLEEVAPDAATLSAPAAIRCMQLTRPSDRAAKAVNRYNLSHMYALSDVSNEAVAEFSKRSGFMIHLFKTLDCVPFAATLLSGNADFNHLETISEEAAAQGKIQLPKLAELSAVGLTALRGNAKIELPKGLGPTN